MTNDQPPPGQPPYGQPPYGYASSPPPQKKRSTLKIVLIVLFVALLLCGGGCAVLLTGIFKAADEAIKESDEKDKQPGGPDNPLEITPGKPFEVLGFKYLAGWSVRKDVFGDVDIRGLRVTNNRDEKDSALVEIKFWRGTEVLAVTDCTTEPIAVGTTTKVDCITADDLPANYDKITINDTF